MQKVLALLRSPQFKLKLFLWLVLAALVAHCSGLKYFCWFSESVFRHNFHGEDLPGATRLVLGLSRFTLFIPAPWFLFVVIQTLRPSISVEGSLLYAVTALLAMVLTFWFALSGLLMPLYWINHIEKV